MWKRLFDGSERSASLVAIMADVAVPLESCQEPTPVPLPRRKSKRSQCADSKSSIAGHNEVARDNKPPPRPKPPTTIKPQERAPVTRSSSNALIRTHQSKSVDFQLDTSPSAGSNVNENYYSGTSTRRRSASASGARIACKPVGVAVSPSTSEDTLNKSTTPSESSPRAFAEKQSPTKAKPLRPTASPVKGSAISNPPTRPPPRLQPQSLTVTPYSSKSVPYSQLYGSTGRNKDDVTVVIDSVSKTYQSTDTLSLKSTSNSPRSRTLPRTHDRKADSESKAHTHDNRYDAAMAYGKRTQAALNKLVSTVKMFSSSSGSSGQNTTPSRRKQHPKIPPKRPPPAVRNTPRPPIPKSASSCPGSCGDTPFITNQQQYDEHIYMEVNQTGYHKYTEDYSEGSGGGENTEDPYVIMNPSSSTHIYTSLSYQTADEFKGQITLIATVFNHSPSHIWKVFR